MNLLKITLDLPASISLADMAQLNDALRTIKDVTLGLCSQGRFKGGPGLYNEAGEVLDDLCELVGRTMDLISERAEAIELSPTAPGYGDDFAERALILIEQELRCEGVTSVAALVRKLYAEPNDPALAASAKYWRAHAAVNAFEGDDRSAESDALTKAWDDAAAHCYRTTPTSTEGVRAFLGVVMHRESGVTPDLETHIAMDTLRASFAGIGR